jgi:uncharacterized SAM-binding protein YcdF (DUF218 family)
LIRRIFLSLLLIWMLGLAWFALTLPQPAGSERTDGVVVLTGGKGRFARGVEVLKKSYSRRLLVSGVDRSVRRDDFIRAQGVAPQIFDCCIELGKQATNTVSNAEEAAQWAAQNKFRSIRLITTDWHMRRARLELEDALDGRATILADGVRSAPDFSVMMVEYHKYLLRRFSLLIGQ